MLQNDEFQTIDPDPEVTQLRPMIIPHSPKHLILAATSVTVSGKHRNFVELTATVNVRRARGTSEILYKILRDGEEVYRSPEWVDSYSAPGKNDIVIINFIDTNVETGPHTYTVTAENLTSCSKAVVVGSTMFSGLVMNQTNRGYNNDLDRDFDRDHDRSRSRAHEKDQDRSSDWNRDKDRSRERDRDRFSSDRSRSRGRDRFSSNRSRSRGRNRDRDRDRDSKEFEREFGRELDKTVDRIINSLDFL